MKGDFQVKNQLTERCEGCEWPHNCPCEYEDFWDDPCWAQEGDFYERDRDYGDENDTTEGNGQDSRDDATGKF